MEWFKILLLWVGVGILTVIIIAIIGLIVAIPVYYLWNWIMPQVFAISAITYWQAWGIYLLASILFKSTRSPKNKKS